MTLPPDGCASSSPWDEATRDIVDSGCLPTLIPVRAPGGGPSLGPLPAEAEPPPDLIESIRGRDLAPPSTSDSMRAHLRRCLSEHAKAQGQGFKSEPPTWPCRLGWE